MDLQAQGKVKGTLWACSGLIRVEMIPSSFCVQLLVQSLVHSTLVDRVYLFVLLRAVNSHPVFKRVTTTDDSGFG